MKKRWNERIHILLPNQTAFDDWGHRAPAILNHVATLWADVSPILAKIPSALVTVRMPVEIDPHSYIQWQEHKWRIVHGPTYFPKTQTVQFKIEHL